MDFIVYWRGRSSLVRSFTPVESSACSTQFSLASQGNALIIGTLLAVDFKTTGDEHLTSTDTVHLPRCRFLLCIQIQSRRF